MIEQKMYKAWKFFFTRREALNCYACTTVQQHFFNPSIIFFLLFPGMTFFLITSIPLTDVALYVSSNRCAKVSAMPNTESMGTARERQPRSTKSENLVEFCSASLRVAMGALRMEEYVTKNILDPFIGCAIEIIRKIQEKNLNLSELMQHFFVLRAEVLDPAHVWAFVSALAHRDHWNPLWGQ